MSNRHLSILKPRLTEPERLGLGTSLAYDIC
jgi:hypothetical protein